MTQLDADYLKKHARALGGLVGNLQSLESVIRIFLYKRRAAPHHPFPRRPRRLNLSILKEGDIVPENAFTSFESLGQLIERYNKIAKRRFPGHELDASVVRVRDALAHGRVWADQPGPPMYLMKFGRPRKGQAKVEFAAPMTLEWLANQTTQARAELQKVAALIERRPRPRPGSRSA